MALYLSSIILAVLAINCQNSKYQNKGVDSINEYVTSVENKNLQSEKVVFYDEYREQDAMTLVTVANSEMTAYKEGGELVKLEVNYNGSHGDLKTTFYCENGNIVYVRKQLDIYNPPKYESESKLSKTIVNEFYLSKQSIIEFKNEGGVIRLNKPNDMDLEEKFEELHQDYNKYIQILSNKN